MPAAAAAANIYRRPPPFYSDARQTSADDSAMRRRADMLAACHARPSLYRAAAPSLHATRLMSLFSCYAFMPLDMPPCFFTRVNICCLMPTMPLSYICNIAIIYYCARETCLFFRFTRCPGDIYYTRRCSMSPLCLY